MANEDPSLHIPQHAAPPPPEIEVRTLESDLKSMSQGGGLALQAEEVSSLISQTASVTQKNEETARHRGSVAFVFTSVILAALALGVVFYFSFSPRTIIESLGSWWNRKNASPTSTLDYVPNREFREPVEYLSFFRLPPDGILEIEVKRGAAQSIEDLETFSQKLIKLLNENTTRGTFLEIRPLDEQGSAFSFPEFGEIAQLKFISREFIENNFEPGFNFFVFRKGGVFYPGYILKLEDAKTPLLLRDEVRIFEQLPELESIFIESPEVPGGSFEDSAVRNLAVRVKKYGESGAVFAYGWFGGRYLVLSSSLEGMSKAFELLAR